MYGHCSGFAIIAIYQLVLLVFKSACTVLNRKLVYVKLFEFNNIWLCVEDKEHMSIS